MTAVISQGGVRGCAGLRGYEGMALLQHDLSLWEIRIRWTGRDPDGLWLRILLDARDRFRTLMDAILHRRFDCYTHAVEKWDPNTPVVWID